MTDEAPVTNEKLLKIFTVEGLLSLMVVLSSGSYAYATLSANVTTNTDRTIAQWKKINDLQTEQTTMRVQNATIMAKLESIEKISDRVLLLIEDKNDG